jgi:hypothetical protein
MDEGRPGDRKRFPYRSVDFLKTMDTAQQHIQKGIEAGATLLYGGLGHPEAREKATFLDPQF